MRHESMIDAAAGASSLAEAGNFQDAVSLYKVAVDQHPHKASLHEQLSQCLLETEQYTEAYAAAWQACSLEPTWPDAALTLARCSLNCGLLAEAHAQYAHYLAMEPEDQSAAQEMAEVRQLQRQQLTSNIGVPGLQIEELQDAEGGPGHVIWEAGIVLSRYLVNHPVLVKGKRVLELGCGTGIVGITAACMGAMAVLTDTAAVVQHAQQNVERNASLIKAKEGSAQCATLVWEMSCSSSVLHKPYDVVIGADLIYAAKDIGPLAETLATLQQHSSDVIIYLAHKERNLGISQELIAQLSSKGIVMQAIFRSGAVTVYMTS
ncbi:hypothetical protein ABBQ32_013853 [Trebouxia sp. C0010 RCD-2024]